MLQMGPLKPHSSGPIYGWAKKLLEKETLVEAELAELKASISAA